MKITLQVGTLLAAVALSSWAQGLRAGQNGPQSNRPAAALDPAKIQVIEGTVTAVQYPIIEVNGTAIKAAPPWFFVDNGFEVKKGDGVKVTAAPCFQPDNGLYALEIVNHTTNASLKLRGESGMPLWGGGRGRRGGMRGGNAAPRGACIDPASVKTVTGVVDKVNAGAGIQMPSLMIQTAEGQTVTMKIGPGRILLASDFKLQPGEPVTAKYALATCTNELVALELTNAAGKTVILRTVPQAN